jgi:ComF family protein
MKFGRKPIAARVLTTLFVHFVIPTLRATQSNISSKHLPSSMPEVLVPVPLSRKRYWRREYNQAQLLCDWLSIETGIPNIAALKRTRHTQAQTALDKQGRINNVDNAFACPIALNYSHIAVVDDVVTTGVTMNAACNAISKTNPHIKISVWAMAVTLLH